MVIVRVSDTADTDVYSMCGYYVYLYLLAGGFAWLLQFRLTYEPSLMSPRGPMSTRVFFGESGYRSTRHLCSHSGTFLYQINQQ